MYGAKVEFVSYIYTEVKDAEQKVISQTFWWKETDSIDYNSFLSNNKNCAVDESVSITTYKTQEAYEADGGL